MGSVEAATAQRLACDTALLGGIVDKHGKVFPNSRNKINKPRSQAGASTAAAKAPRRASRHREPAERLARKRSWRRRHVIALATGALQARAAIGFLVDPIGDVAPAAKYVHNAFS